jgi:hypothetical protein
VFTSPAPFSVVLNRARRLVDSLEARLHSQEISSRAQLLEGVLDAVANFTRTLTEPLMRPLRMSADELLIKELVATPVGEANEDVELAHLQVDELRALTHQIFNVCQAERAGLSDSLAECQSLVDEYRVWVSDSDPTFLWASDTFNDRSKVDGISSIFVDTRAGTLTLNPISSISLSDRITELTIDRKQSAGGLPGNNLEIRAPGQVPFSGVNPEPRPVMYRDNRPRPDNIAAILDGNPDSWFEWERVYVPAPQPTIQVGQALVSDPAGTPNQGIPAMDNWNCFIQWPGDQQIDQGRSHVVTTKTKVKKKGLAGLLGLKKTKTTRTRVLNGHPLAYFHPEDREDLVLALEITLDQPRPVSWVQLTPYLRGTAYPTVDQILVSNDGSRWRRLLETPTVLNPRINRGVDFTQLGAAASNFEGVGVWATPQVPIRYLRITLRQTQVYDTPLGIGHRFYTQNIPGKKYKNGTPRQRRSSGPIPVVGSADSTLSAAPQTDYSASETATQLEATELFDIFTAERQVIGIRDLLLEERTYAETGQFVSTPFILATPARAVALITTEKIPEDWAAAAPDGKPWLFHEVSADGQSWQTIVPQVGQLQDSVVHFETPTTTVFLRTTFSRPLDRAGETPILQAYALKLLP